MNNLLWVVLYASAIPIAGILFGVGFWKARIWVLNWAFRSHQTQE